MNKRIQLSLLLITFFSSNIHSQITKGNWLVGGTLSYSNIKSKSSNTSQTTTSNLELMPNGGYFILDKLAVGIKFNGVLNTTKYPLSNGSTNKVTQNVIGFGPFIRYYFLETGKKINILSDAGLIYSTVTNNSIAPPDNKSTSIDYSIFAGPVIFLNQTVGIEFLVGYQHEKDLNVDYNSNTIKFKIGLQIHLEKE